VTQVVAVIEGHDGEAAARCGALLQAAQFPDGNGVHENQFFLASK
jgi:hypothetical protein